MSTRPVPERAAELIAAYERTGSSTLAAKEVGCSKQQVNAALNRWKPQAKSKSKPKAKPKAKPKPALALPDEETAALVVHLDAARTALQAATTPLEAKRVRDVAQAAKDLAQAQRMAQEIIDYAARITVEATTQMGLLWDETEKNVGTRLNGKKPGNIGGVVEPPPMITTLREMGVSKSEIRLASGMARVYRDRPELYDEVLAGKKSMTAAVREVANKSEKSEKSEKPAHLQALDALVARACLSLIPNCPEFSAVEELQTGCRNEAKRLDDLVVELIRADPDRAVRTFLDEALRRHPPLNKLIEFARAQLARKG